MHHTTLTLLALSTSALAGPLIPRKSGSQQTAMFDNLPANTANTPVAPLTSLGPYQSLSFNGLAVDAPGPNFSPASAPNVISFDLVSQLQSTPAITSMYDDSTTTFFDLSSFSFACLLMKEAAEAEVPETCSMTVKAFAGDTMVDEQTFTYDKHALLGGGMQEAVLPGSFVGLQRVEFGLGEDAVEDALLVGLLDDVAYTSY